MATHVTGFKHTQYAIYLVITFSAACVLIDSAQGVVERFNLNRRWYYLFGATCLFAYLYVRPQINLRLGSAAGAQISWSSLYILWLCSAVFYHLPSLDSLGIDLRADLSILLTTFLLSLAVLGAAAAAHAAALALAWVRPWLAHPSAASVVALHAANLALACSTYHNFCEAGAEAGGEAPPGTGPRATLLHLFRPTGVQRSPWRKAVCERWLAPVPVAAFPAFSSWVIYSEEAREGLPPGAPGLVLDREGGTISPIFSLWLTLVAMLGATCLSDYAAASAMHAAASLARRKALAAEQRRSRRVRRRSADLSYDLLGQQGRSAMPSRTSFDVLVRTMSSVGSLWSPRKLRAASSLLFRDDFGLELGWGEGGEGSPRTPAPPPPQRLPDDAPAPAFLPMFPWYSGTSADLLKTLFDLMVSVKVFLGRFDMRTMQVATASEWVAPDPTPQDGDGFTFEHLAEGRELWFDFCADTGDGGDPTYAVARALAAPSIQVALPAEAAAAGAAAHAGPSFAPSKRTRTLPRGRVLLHGGDLAYPNPTEETYRTRLFSLYEAALPPPPHVHKGHLVVNKPDVGRGLWTPPPRCLPTCPRRGAGPVCRLCHKATALRRYEGPSSFAIPGNHDWIDGLETFSRHILHRGWLGGWLLPQEKSYWALRLPAGWWVFGIDLALVDDIDTCQYKYFARVAETRMAPTDQAILIMHCPRWLVDWFWGTDTANNLRHLVRGPLRGRARLAVAGDLHFYMRHSFQPYDAPGASSSLVPSAASTPAGGSPVGGSPGSSRAPTPRPDASAPAGVSPTAVQARIMAHLSAGGAGGAAGVRHGMQPPFGNGGSLGAHGRSPSAPSLLPVGAAPGGANAAQRLEGRGPAGGTPPPRETLTPFAAVSEEAEASGDTPRFPSGGSGPLPALTPLHVPARGGCGGDASPSAASTSSVLTSSWWPELRMAAGEGQGGGGSGAWGRPGTTPGTAGGTPPAPEAGWRLTDPEHLLVSGSGGAFLHPTHAFSYARFRPPRDAAAGPLFVCDRAGTSGEGFGRAGASSGLRGRSPDPSCPPGGEYRCAAAYPSAQQSESIGRRNLHMFRNMNTRFDVIGGALYYLLVVSVLPRCRHLAAVLEAPDWGTGLSLLLGAAADTVGDIFLESYVSLLALLCMAALALGFAATGGIGAKGDATAADRQRPEFKGRGLAVRARLGGFTTRFLFASLHCAAHVCCAVFLLLLLELGIETVIRHEQLGREGYHSLYKWYRQYEAAHFPDPADMRGAAERWTLGLYPGAIKWAMAAFDAPEAIAVSRDLLCAGRELNRLQALGYYGGVLAYYWLLATPTVALVFGAYLYICVNWFGVHYDEAFSSLQVPDHKGFLRMHITPAGDLEIFSLGLDTVPRAWREDPAWRAPGGGGDAGVPGWRARHPSRWVPVEVRGGYTLRGTPPEAALKVVDYLHVPRQRPVIV
ncbi:hypothetical protein ACKKBG_A17180 [Auxenochlorella protothecoides x Auxenochlorella symbiontica]